jgi:hypothetical protein
MTPDPESLAPPAPPAMPYAEFRALVARLREAQRRPSVRRTFYSTDDKDDVFDAERDVDRELARRDGGEVAT